MNIEHINDEIKLAHQEATSYSPKLTPQDADDATDQRPPWVVFDPDSHLEFLTPQRLRYYVAKDASTGMWFICDLWNDTAVHGTEARTRSEAIHLIYAWCSREIPQDTRIKPPQPNTSHHGWCSLPIR